MNERMTDREHWVETVTAARARGLVFFDLLTAVDHEDRGFEVVLHLWDPVARTGEVLRTSCPRDDPAVPTLTHLFAGARWHERATAELFGITFQGHRTTPLLLPESFEGHPLRKDFVLAARVAKRWPGAKEPGESTADSAADSTADSTADMATGNLPTPGRRRLQPPGVPTGWGQP